MASDDVDNFKPHEVDQPTMAILLAASGWSWDYWGKFYGPPPESPKMRDLRRVLHHVRSSWKCERCDCDPGCPCCGPQDCRTDDAGYVTVPPAYRREAS